MICGFDRIGRYIVKQNYITKNAIMAVRSTQRILCGAVMV